MSKVQVKFAWEDSGNCRNYYRTLGTGQLICLQDEGGAGSIWYYCIDDDCWNEPSHPVNMRLNDIEIVESL